MQTKNKKNRIHDVHSMGNQRMIPKETQEEKESKIKRNGKQKEIKEEILETSEREGRIKTTKKDVDELIKECHKLGLDRIWIEDEAKQALQKISEIERRGIWQLVRSSELVGQGNRIRLYREYKKGEGVSKYPLTDNVTILP